MSICSLGSQGGRERGTILGKRYRGKQKRRSEWKERRAYRREREEGGGEKNFSREPFPGARFSVGETFIVPTKLLYLSIGKTKASYLFLFPYSPRHVSFRFPVSFFFSLSFLFSLFFFNARHVLLPSPESLLHATRSLILAIFSTSRSANSSRSGRASVHRSGGVVVYFVPVWIDLLAACLPQHGETFRSPRNWSSPREKEGNGERERLYFRMCRAKYERNSSTGEDEDRPR